MSSQSTQTRQTRQTSQTSQTREAPTTSQPYGNQAALQDAGLAPTATEPVSDECAYLAVLGASWVDYAATLNQCLDAPNVQAHRRWLEHQRLDDVRENAPELLGRARDAMWPMDRRIGSEFAGKFVTVVGGEVSGAASTERNAEGFRVELRGEAAVAAGFDGLGAGLPTFGDESLLLGASADATLSGGFRVEAAWNLPTDAMDANLGNFTLLTGIDELVKTIDMLIENLTTPDALKIEAIQDAEVGAAIGAGVGANAGAEIDLAASAGYDEDYQFVTASITGGAAFGLDIHVLAALGNVVRDGLADFKGSMMIRAEFPKDFATNPEPPRFFFCWSTASETSDGREERGNTSSTWVEVGLLQDAINFIKTLLFLDKVLGTESGDIALADLPDRTLVRAVEHRIEDDTFVAQAMTAAGLNKLAITTLPLARVDSEVRAKGEIRVTTAAVVQALAGAPSLNAWGDNAESAVLDAERQIAAWFLGEHYQWAGSAQLEGHLANALPACTIADSCLEATRTMHVGLQAGPGSGSVSTQITGIIDITPAELHSYMAL